MELTEEQENKLKLTLERKIYDIADDHLGWWVQETFTKNKEPDVDVARRILEGIENGDPQVLDSLPYIDWSGQHADGPDWNATFADAWWTAFHKDIEEDYNQDVDDASDGLYFDMNDGDLIGMCEVHCRNILEDE